jgi:uncharacterized repeat protein (TIGR02059 family)
MRHYIFTILFVVSVVISGKSQDYSGYTRCAEQDSLALVAFYNATDGPNWKSNQDGFSINDLGDDVLVYHTETYPNAGRGKWLQGPVKDWFGVLLEKQPLGATGDSVWRVVHVRTTVNRRSAGNNNLKGYIPREIGLLTALKWFKVNGNLGLEATELPDELYHPTLTTLDIEACKIKGEISNKIRNCKSLGYFNIRTNAIDSIPIFDFLTPEHLLNSFNPNSGWQIMFLYTNRISYSNIEPSVDYFLSFSAPKQVQYEARQQNNIGREVELIVEPGQKVVLSTPAGGENGVYTWYKRGINTYMQGKTFTINSVAAKDTGSYYTLIANDYIRLNDLNSDYASVFSSPIYVRFAPVAPSVTEQASSYNGMEISLTFSKPMAVPTQVQAAQFTVTSGGRNLAVSSIARGGRFNEKLILKLASPIVAGESVEVAYSEGTVVCENKGALKTFTNKTVKNFTRVVPKITKLETRNDGTGIFITFDQYIDGATLSAANFKVTATTSTSVQSVVLDKGTIDANISKTVELIMTEPLKPNEVIKVSYTPGTLEALYGGRLDAQTDLAVQNIVVENRTTVLIQVEDGTKSLPLVVVKGNLRNLPFNLFDDGTNGDLVAGDHIWSRTLDLNEGNYTWEVYKRVQTTSYDTVTTVANDGTITQILTPKVVNDDTFLSNGFNLQFLISNKTLNGVTIFGYRNNVLTFELDMSGYKGTAEVAPILMGINDDWTEGLELTHVSGNKWTVSVGNFVIGQTVYFNFRNGKDWENNSPEVRFHTVTSNTTLYCKFGIVTSLAQKDQVAQVLKVYPNPVWNTLNVSINNTMIVYRMQILDISGRILLDRDSYQPTIDVSNLKQGTYLIRLLFTNGQTYQSIFLKK